MVYMHLHDFKSWDWVYIFVATFACVYILLQNMRLCLHNLLHLYMLSFKLHTCKLLVCNGYSMLRLYMAYMFLHDFKTCALVCIFCCNCCMYMVLHVLMWLQNMGLSLYILLQLFQRFIHYFKHVVESVYLVATITCLL